MNDRTLKDFMVRLDSLSAQMPSVRIGEVITASPLTVAVGGGEAIPSRRAAAYAPTIADVVLVLRWGNDIVVLDKLAS